MHGSQDEFYYRGKSIHQICTHIRGTSVQLQGEFETGMITDKHMHKNRYQPTHVPIDYRKTHAYLNLS